jgi:hypothetical protein
MDQLGQAVDAYLAAHGGRRLATAAR